MRLLTMLAFVLVAGRAIADPTPDALRAATTTLLAEWARLQHDGDAKGYLALYDARHFKGTKRTSSGDRKEYAYAAWAADRSKMIKNHPEVAVENVTIDTWRDAHKTLKPNLIHVRFTQRWRTPRYADHGPKIMQLVYSDDKGKPNDPITLKIVYEGLLQSRPGWDQPEATKVSLKTPATDAEARALWLFVGATGKDWEQKLASIPDAPQIRRALARSVLAEDLDCRHYVNEGQCGVDDWRWGPLPEKADFQDPCLRRLLGIWAVGELDASDLKARLPQLLHVFDYKRPQQEYDSQKRFDGDELCVAVVEAATAVPEVLVQVILVAVAAHCGEAEARAAVASLGEKARVRLAEADIEEAFTSLSVKTYPALFIGALGGGGSADFKIALMKIVASAGLSAPMLDKLKTTLKKLADEANPKISTAAAVTLEGLGDPSRLPHRPDTTVEADFERQLQRLFYDPDTARRAKQLRAFFPPGQGSVKIVDTTETEYDGNTAPDDRQAHREEVSRMPYDEADFALLRVFVDGSTDGESQTLTWKIIRKKLYLVGISSTTHHFSGCGC